MYFKDFETDEMLQETSEEKHLYSVQGKKRKSVNKCSEIEKILGMCIYIELMQMPNIGGDGEKVPSCL